MNYMHTSVYTPCTCCFPSDCPVGFGPGRKASFHTGGSCQLAPHVVNELGSFPDRRGTRFDGQTLPGDPGIRRGELRHVPDTVRAEVICMGLCVWDCMPKGSHDHICEACVRNHFTSSFHGNWWPFCGCHAGDVHRSMFEVSNHPIHSKVKHAFLLLFYTLYSGWEYCLGHPKGMYWFPNSKECPKHRQLGVPNLGLRKTPALQLPRSPLSMPCEASNTGRVYE